MKKLILFRLILLLPLLGQAQSHLGVLSKTEQNRKGYILYAPLNSMSTLLVDKSGNMVHSWRSETVPAQSSVFLLPNSKLLRTGKDSSTSFKTNGGGIIERLSWNGDVEWTFKISDPFQKQHHEICPLPSGNILVIVWEKKFAEEAIKNGRNPALLGTEIWSEKIIEVKPKGKNQADIVWEWHVWDHLVQDFDSTKKNFGNVADSPGRFNINYNASSEPDWMHFNGLSFNPALNQIMISSAHFNEFYIIEHSNTKSEIASQKAGKIKKSGDILYRWGNPAAYNRGGVEDKKLFRQHDAHWVNTENGTLNRIMVFNNGVDRLPMNYSTVDVIEIPLQKDHSYKVDKTKAFGPDSLYWQYNPTEEQDRFFSRNMSGAQQLLNGNVLICEGANGKFIELDKDNHKVWEFINMVTKGKILLPGELIQGNEVFKCIFYEPSYPGLKGKQLKPYDAF